MKFNLSCVKFFSESPHTILRKKLPSKKNNIKNLLLQSHSHNNHHINKELFSKELANLRSGNPLILKEKDKIKYFIDELNNQKNLDILKEESYFTIESILYFLIQNKVKNPIITEMYLKRISKENLNTLKQNDIQNKFNLLNKIMENTYLQSFHVDIYKSFMDSFRANFDLFSFNVIIENYKNMIRFRNKLNDKTALKDIDFYYKNYITENLFKKNLPFDFYRLYEIITNIKDSVFFNKNRLKIINLLKSDKSIMIKNIDKYVYLLILTNFESINLLTEIPNILPKLEFVHINAILESLSNINQGEEVITLMINSMNKIEDINLEGLIKFYSYLDKYDYSKKMIEIVKVKEIEIWINNTLLKKEITIETISTIDKILYIFEQKVIISIAKKLCQKILKQNNKNELIFDLLLISNKKNIAINNIVETKVILDIFKEFELLKKLNLEKYHLIFKKDKILLCEFSKFLSDLILQWEKKDFLEDFFKLFYQCYKTNLFENCDEYLEQVNISLSNMSSSELMIIRLKKINFLNQYLEMYRNKFITNYKNNVRLVEKINKYFMVD